MNDEHSTAHKQMNWRRQRQWDDIEEESKKAEMERKKKYNIIMYRI